MLICIKNGLIVDGTGEKPFYGDVLIKEDKICKIAPTIDENDEMEVIDASGLTVIPGIIDGHTHSEIDIIRNPQQAHAVYQGITTVVTGQCGLGFAPMRPENLEDSIRMNSGIFGDWSRHKKCWTSFAEMLFDLDGAAVNVGANVSHNAIRQYACGFADIPLIGDRLNMAKEQLRRALQDGATGFSVGLSYYPGGYSDTEELIQLCNVVAEENGVLCVHLRLDDGQVPFHPVDEIVEVVRKTNVKVNMLHYRTGGMEDVSTLFSPFEEVEKNGADIHYEYYPYFAGAGLILALLPGWVQEGGYEKIMFRLKSAELRKKLLTAIEERKKYFFAEGQTATIIITKSPYSPYLRKTIAQIMEENQESFAETIVRLLVENDLQVGFAGQESQPEKLKQKLLEDQYRLFLNEKYTIGSDTIPTPILTHPRTSGTFPRIISRMLDRNVPAEEVIRKITSVPAQIYGIKNRGILQEGMQADITVFDSRVIKDMADFSDGRKKADGIHHVLVNGLFAMKDESLTGVFGGRAIRRGR